jgi:hypothetical protein
VLLAGWAETPELAITDDEGAKFLAAAQNVMRHYSVKSTQKTLDWITFAGISAQIYGQRFMALSIRLRLEQNPRPPMLRPLASVTPIRQNAPPQAQPGQPQPQPQPQSQPQAQAHAAMQEQPDIVPEPDPDAV